MPRRLASFVAAAALGAATAVLARRALAMREVLPEFRSPRLLVPLDIPTPGSATLIRRLGARKLDRREEFDLDGVHVSSVRVPGGLDGYRYEVPGRATPGGAVLWIHGGGMVIGAPEGDHERAARIARETGALVLSARYRLAPEHPFPAGFNDCFAALRMLQQQAEALGIDAERIAVAGASAGGGLAAAVAQRALDEGVPVAFQALVYPMLDDRTVLRPDHEGRGVFVWSPRSNRSAWTAYLGGTPTLEAAPAYAAPARRSDFARLPPAWIGVGELDLFFEEDCDYAERLRAAGVPVTLHLVTGMFHGTGNAHPDAPATAEFENSLLTALRRAIG